MIAIRPNVMTSRRGTSLVEVLAAMFIMTIGMLSLLALFPLALFRMEQALRDERASQAAQQAAAIAGIRDFRHDSSLTSWFRSPAPGTTPDAVDGYPSYGVFLDPIGYRNAVGGPSQDYVGSTIGPRMIRRTSPAAIPSSSRPLVNTWFTLADELQFDQTGNPASVTGSPTTFKKEVNFSWAYLVQRPDFANESVVDCTAVIYHRRPELSATITLPEYNFVGAAIDVNANTISLPIGAGLPKIKSGDWFLDCTSSSASASGANIPAPHAKFYRVLGVREISGSLLVELNGPITGFGNRTTGDFIFMESVYDVVPLGTGRIP